MRLTKRSEEKELLDLGPNFYTHDEYIHCLKKLFLINRLFGFFHSTVNILKKFPGKSTLLDIGCGGGLFILQLSKIFPHMQLHGIDISHAAIMDAQKSLQNSQKNNANSQVSFQLQTQAQLNLAKNSYDIILITLVCHHISDDDLVIFLQLAHQAASKAVIINDLHRHVLAYWLYGLISPIFRNRLITHDGLISIRRGFTYVEWQLLLQRAGLNRYRLKWCFPFRWQLILTK